jgi:hypothetical protein
MNDQSSVMMLPNYPMLPTKLNINESDEDTSSDISNESLGLQYLIRPPITNRYL